MPTTRIKESFLKKEKRETVIFMVPTEGHENKFSLPWKCKAILERFLPTAVIS